jgi:VWFA-related protein
MRVHASFRAKLNFSLPPTGMFSVGFLAACLCLLNPAVLGAQDTPSVSQSAPPLRVATHLVQVHVIVQTEKGEPVTGLTKEDFTLLDQGQPEKIAFVSEQSGGLQTAPAQPLPPDTFSNRYDQTGQAPGSVTVILLDALNTGFSSQSYAKESVVKALHGLNPGDHVALYVLGDQLTVVQDFTQDSAALLRTLDHYKGKLFMSQVASTPDPSNTGDAVVDALRNSANQKAASSYIAQRTQLTSQFITAIANHLASVPGRKNLVWLSSDYPVSVDSLARALNQADMAIYPVDPCGLADPTTLTFDPGCPVVPEVETMDGLANRTGGRASHNNNDIQGSVRTAIDDGRVSYVLGYYPDHGKWDGQFREIDVKVDRPGVQVRSRKGYFALADTSPSPKEMHDVIGEALMSPLDSTGLGLTVSVQPGPQLGQAIFILNLDAQEVRLDEDAGQWKGGLEIVFRQYDAKGDAIGGVESHLTLNLPKEMYDRVMQQGIKMTKQLAIAPGAETLKVLALDTSSGTMGTVSVPVGNYAPSAANHP